MEKRWSVPRLVEGIVDVASCSSIMNMKYARFQFGVPDSLSKKARSVMTELHPDLWWPDFGWLDPQFTEEGWKTLIGAALEYHVRNPDPDGPGSIASEDEATAAAHEAGHIIVGECFGWTVRRARITFDWETYSGPFFEWIPTRIDNPNSDVTPEDLRAYIEDFAAMMLGGVVFEGMLLGGRVRYFWEDQSDFMRLTEGLSKQGFSNAEIRTFLRTGVSKAAAILAENRFCVLQVALGLLDGRALEEDALQKLIAEAKVPCGRRWELAPQATAPTF